MTGSSDATGSSDPTGSSTASGATVVVGTAGHIDHGKTTLLRALTGIDADRLPEERARGMTIDVGFAHLDLDDGTSLDFVDVPGHDRLVGNMLVGAGEIDAVLLVVAADDGPRAQTLEHLELLDALGLTRAVVAITKADAVSPERGAEVAGAVEAILGRTAFAGATIVEVSSTTGAGLPALRHALVALRDAVRGDRAGRPPGPLRLPVDRAFTVKGRGLVVTGTLRGGSVAAGTSLRAEPGLGEARVREVQVHHGRAERADGGRAALNLAGLEAAAVTRGVVLTAGPGVAATDRVLVVLRRPAALRPSGNAAWPPAPSAALRLHTWTDTVDARIRARGAVLPDGRAVRVLALARPVATMPGAAAVLRDPGAGSTVAGVTILDVRPPRGVARRRMTSERLSALAAAPAGRDEEAILDLHGALASDGRALALAPDVAEGVRHTAADLADASPTIAELRAGLLRDLRQRVTLDRTLDGAAIATADRAIDDLLASGSYRRDAERIRPSDAAAGGASGNADARLQAIAALERALDVDVPPSLADAVRSVGATPEAVIQLERAGRIVRVEDDLAWSTQRYTALRDRAVSMARRGPLAPAAFRDAIGGNRRVVMPLLEDFDRKGFLRRTPAGHVPGPRA